MVLKWVRVPWERNAKERESWDFYNMIPLILIVLLSLLYLYKTSDISYFDIVG
jgi:hypothetical protein